MFLSRKFSILQIPHNFPHIKTESVRRGMSIADLLRQMGIRRLKDADVNGHSHYASMDLNLLEQRFKNPTCVDFGLDFAPDVSSQKEEHRIKEDRERRNRINRREFDF